MDLAKLKACADSVSTLSSRMDAHMGRADAVSHFEEGETWSVKLTKDGETKRVKVAAANARAALEQALKDNSGWNGAFQHVVRG